MKKSLSHALAGLLLVAGTSLAVAQAVVIAPEQETAIREFVVKQNTASVQIPADVTIEVGATLPDTIELHTLDVPDVTYRYIVVDGRTVLVDPDTRKIVHIIG